ncbi:MAG TPA: DUF72 domain-containing protein [Noviherbaspirillum sp.]|uniref:DUF72 domain-containing protein n=1 Tax=Noviherbaspirillum sp. TaxID=1926288 RepID=UPI002B46531C|nr:DUF72 domain-containing protein [Noviherbaspirillum sp.]HJV87273.1 DUF72 domain-containing protein [Noviherbaspirillum sp.]
MDRDVMTEGDASPLPDAPASGPFIGCAGWNLSSAAQAFFPEEGSHLERYAAVLPAVEINTSFYRPHRPVTYARWSASVPDDFRFAAKIPKEITHEMRLRNAAPALRKFFSEASHLGEKLDCLLVQLPPRLQFDASTAAQFFHALRELTSVTVACEPRHPSWFTDAAANVLAHAEVIYVEADPPVAPLPAAVHAARSVYLRLHGSPHVYHSTYSESDLDRLAERIEQDMLAGKDVWCIFDNTAEGAAVPNALGLLARLREVESGVAGVRAAARALDDRHGAVRLRHDLR